MQTDSSCPAYSSRIPVPFRSLHTGRFRGLQLYWYYLKIEAMMQSLALLLKSCVWVRRYLSSTLRLLQLLEAREGDGKWKFTSLRLWVRRHFISSFLRCYLILFLTIWSSCFYIAFDYYFTVYCTVLFSWVWGISPFVPCYRQKRTSCFRASSKATMCSVRYLSSGRLSLEVARRKL